MMQVVLFEIKKINLFQSTFIVMQIVETQIGPYLQEIGPYLQEIAPYLQESLKKGDSRRGEAHCFNNIIGSLWIYIPTSEVPR